MFLKNYTSAVPVHQTIHRIEATLIKCGVNGIMKEYGPNSAVAAITFHIKLAENPVTIRLPVDVNRALEALWLDYAGTDKLTPDGNRLAWNNSKKKVKADFRDQAERTAWKIVQDWVEVQMSMIQMKQADFQEVFLPYIHDGNETFYNRLKSTGFRALLQEKT